jgi:hypothetical protein
VNVGLACHSEDFTSIIMAASAAKIVGAFKLSAIGAFLKGFNRKRIVAAAHIALGG